MTAASTTASRHSRALLFHCPFLVDPPTGLVAAAIRPRRRTTRFLPLKATSTGFVFGTTSYPGPPGGLSLTNATNTGWQDATPGFHFVDLSDTGVIFYYLDATAPRAGTWDLSARNNISGQFLGTAFNGSFEFLVGVGQGDVRRYQLHPNRDPGANGVCADRGLAVLALRAPGTMDLIAASLSRRAPPSP